MATTVNFKNGLVIKHDNKFQQIVEFQYVKPGKGPAFVRTELKDVLTGKVVNKALNAGVKIETADADRCDMTYLYYDGDGYVFMDDKTLDQISILGAQMPEGAKFLPPETTCQVSFHEGNVLFAEMSVSVELKVEHTDPGLRGDRSTGDTKPATMETGAEIQAPLSIETDDVLKVDTRDGLYVSRVNH